jgi:hypothetical protein
MWYHLTELNVNRKVRVILKLFFKKQATGAYPMKKKNFLLLMMMMVVVVVVVGCNM